jgi:hypothetical protein
MAILAIPAADFGSRVQTNRRVNEIDEKPTEQGCYQIRGVTAKKITPRVFRTMEMLGGTDRSTETRDDVSTAIAGMSVFV